MSTPRRPFKVKRTDNPVDQEQATTSGCALDGAPGTPVIVLRDVVVFPHIVIPLFVGRSLCIKGIEYAVAHEKRILLVTQRNSADDTLSSEALYSFGTIGTILQFLKLRDGTVKILVEGIMRAHVRELDFTDGGIFAHVEEVCDSHGSEEVSHELTILAITMLASQNKKIPSHVVDAIAKLDDKDRVADTIAAHADFPVVRKQALLELDDVAARLKQIVEWLEVISSESSGGPGDSQSQSTGQPIGLKIGAEKQTVLDMEHAEAVRIAYRSDIEEIARILRAGLSTLVFCDKVVTVPLAHEIVRAAGLKKKVVSAKGDLMRGVLDEEFSLFRASVAEPNETGEVVVLDNLDILAGSNTPGYVSDAARAVTQMVHRYCDRLMLAFADPTIDIPEMLASRFATRRTVLGIPHTVRDATGKSIPFGMALITSSEAAYFKDFDPGSLYRTVAGMNPIQFRNAIRYVIHEFQDERPIPAAKLFRGIRSFKARNSAIFEIPDVDFEDIGGYPDVKETLRRAITLMNGGYQLPSEALRNELIPKGFVLYGPPGTGKTYFAKAIANHMNANVVVVSGPEVINMYLGESERRIRELFGEARRHAPSVLIFDEFDAIAGRRSGRSEPASRAQNAIVAQILSEMDGFRPEVQMLVIGTTNRIDIIDEALLRPGRFQSIAIDLPGPDARREIARIHARRFEFDLEAALLEQIVRSTNLFNGDDIRSLFRDAFLARHTGDTRLRADGAEVSDAFLFGRLVREVRNRLEEEQKQAPRRTITVGVLSEAGARSHLEGDRQMLAGMVRIAPETGL